MSFLRRAAVAGMLAGTALASTTGSALASEADHGDGDQHGLVNVGDVQTVAPLTACNNDVPVNAAGVQVPVEDVSGVLGLLGDEDSDGAASQPESQSCGTGIDAAA